MQGTVLGEGLPRQVLEMASLARAVFGTKLCSVLLYGSAALRGTRPDSDLDLLLVTEREMTQDERLQMTGRLLALSGPVGCRDRRPMEVTVFSRRDLLQVRGRPGWQYQYGEWLRQELLRGALPQRSENPDAILLFGRRAVVMCRCGDVRQRSGCPDFPKRKSTGQWKGACRSCCLF